MNIKVKSLKLKVKNSFSGQAVIIVLLVMVVALTIGLSISARSVKDIRLSTRTEESQRAFSAAEAGLEVALLKGSSVQNSIPSLNASYNVSVMDAGADNYFSFPGTIAKDDTQTVWLVSHDETTGEIQDCATASCYTGSSIQINWGNKGTVSDSNITPALEVSIIYKEGSDFKIEKYAYDPNSSRAGSNGFNTSSVSLNPPATPDGKEYAFYITQDLPSGSGIENYALRLRFLYSNNQKHVLAVVRPASVASNIPIQGKKYESKGEAKISGSGESEVRTVSFFKSYPALPGIFDFVLFSGSDLSK